MMIDDPYKISQEHPNGWLPEEVEKLLKKIKQEHEDEIAKIVNSYETERVAVIDSYQRFF